MKMVLTNSKALLALSQVDLLLSFILFTVENLIPIHNDIVHKTILITASASVLLALWEIVVISKKQYWCLLTASGMRLGPMVGLSIFWLVSSKRYYLPTVAKVTTF